MNLEEKKYKYQTTSNYDRFKFTTWNREDIERRVKKVVKSIGAIGFLPIPIVVNEKDEVIDGQARVLACKQLGIPVPFVVINGASREECVALNISQTSWSLSDYIHCYAAEGNVSYIYLLHLIKAYGKTFKLKILCNAVSGKMDVGNSAIKEQKFECSPEQYNHALDVLTWLTGFIPIISRIGGHSEFYYMALSYCYTDAEVDNNRLFAKMESRQASLIPVTTIHQALDQIEAIYNHGNRSKVYITTNYKKSLDRKYAWYERKYGSKYRKGDKLGGNHDGK